MENKLDHPKLRNQSRKGILLPNYFKIIGLVLIVLPMILGLIFRAIENRDIDHNKASIQEIMKSAMILGLLFIAWSRDKVEDELTISLRLRSIAFSSILVVLKVIIVPMIDLVGGEPWGEPTNRGLIIQMMTTYLLLYYAQKYNLIYFAKEKGE